MHFSIALVGVSSMTFPSSIVLACSVAIYLQSAAHAQCLSLSSPTDYPQPGSLTALASGDFNGHGGVDLAFSTVVNGPGGPVLRIMLGNGTGGFVQASDYSQPGSLTALACGDFDGDDRMDLAFGTVSGPAGAVLRVMLGNGNGGFVQAGDYPQPGSLTALACGDFNGDGRVDLAFGTGGAVLRVMLGNGNGGFVQTGDYQQPGSLTALASGDFNGDGRMDLAFGTVSGLSGAILRVMLGNGNGGFVQAGDYQQPGSLTALSCGDFDGDGRMDLAFGTGSGLSGAVLRVMLGNGNGGFVQANDYPQPGSLTALACGDFNADSRMDLAFGTVNGFSGAVLRTLANSGAVGAFPQPANRATCAFGTTSIAVVGAGSGPFTYQWQWRPLNGTAWNDVQEGLNFDSPGGSTRFIAHDSRAAICSIENFGGMGAVTSHWEHRCVITNGCGTIASHQMTFTVCAADFSCDGFVDDTDFVLFATAYDILVCPDPSKPASCPTDINGDGQVDDIDFVLFASAYDLFSCQ
jgi:hypothetical protein